MDQVTACFFYTPELLQLFLQISKDNVFLSI